ncbi:Transglutaminase-like superfamily protein [Enhydrobacter aerosaccus]|uniref:Transglutaminase-like superfamily protein n=1 Tax=Enhydrobacter aerosaccus TaxID=225324 RepID=A0A1T4SZI1_9HYPH|nr:lasso peptide biosynthesis B2 protein [Enhydrobacter aerosaccus]SKA33338.1 Transglutaminase-like superfamily protein [Enhydrobacter aerosaccus]
MSRLTAFAGLTGVDRRLLVEAFATLLLIRIALHAWRLERLRKWAARPGTGTAPLERIVWAVRTASRHLPGTTCLCSALSLQRMLSSRGYGSALHIGVSRNGERFGAHAWLVRDGEVLIGEREAADYTFLTAWAAGDSSS